VAAARDPDPARWAPIGLSAKSFGWEGRTMFHGANLPIIGEFADPALLAGLAVDAEEAGWDGVFVRDTLLFDTRRSAPADPTGATRIH